MLTWTDDPESGVIELTVDGPIDREAIAALLALCEQRIEERGELRLLKRVKRVGMIEPSALWEDLKFLYHHWSDVTRVAAVGGAEWQRRLGEWLSPLAPCETRMFGEDEIEAARAWLRER